MQKIKVVGIRPGEKLHEEMITKSDSLNTIEFKNFYVIFSDAINHESIKLSSTHRKNFLRRIKSQGGKVITKQFSYNSESNTEFMTINQIRGLIKNLGINNGSEKISFTNILGVGKNGTTLMGSLLDNHQEISTFPMEMKFIEHYFNTIKDKSFESIIKFLLKESKINQLNLHNKLSDKEEEIKRVVTGNLTSIYFDKEKFEKIIIQNTTEKIKNEKDFKKYSYFFACLFR